MSKNSKQTVATQKKKGSLWTIFMHADGLDVFLMVLGLIGAIGDGLTLPLKLFVVSKFMNNIGNKSNLSNPNAFTHNINRIAEILCIMAVGGWIVCFLEGYCWTITAERQATKMRCKYLKAVLRQDVSYFDLHVASSSEVITSVSSDSLIIQDVISEKVPNFVVNISTFVGSYVTAFVMAWRLAIVGFPFIIFLVFPGLMYGRIMMGIARKLTIEYNNAAVVVEHAISSIRTVYAFVGESKTMAKFSAALEGSLKLGLKEGLVKGMGLGSSSVAYAVWAFNTWYGSKLVMYHGIRGGTVFAVCGSLAYGGTAFGTALSNIKYLSEAIAAGERIMEVIKRVPKIDSDNMEGLILENTVGEVEFKNVNFAYPSRPECVILQDFSLRIPAGKTIALVGGSGSGKSTTIALLQRYYDPLDGDILLDGVAIDKLQIKWLRSQMGLVSQEPALFSATIKENILFGKEDATMEEIVDTAKASNVHNFISQLPMGYDTQVGERGVQMSGGQKQRIAIARAMIMKPRILLLDEATSALDSESERLVQEALDKAALGRSTIIIAHRLSTIRNADTIAVMQNGQLMEVGSHDDLIQHENGLYTSLFRLQETKKSEDEASSSHLIPLSPSLTENKESICSTDSARLSTMSRLNSANSTSTNNVVSKNLAIHKDKPPTPSFRRLLALNLPEWKQAFLGGSSAVLIGALQPFYALAMGSMIAVYFLQDHKEMKRQTAIYTSCFLGMAVFSFTLNIVQQYYLAYMGEHLTMRVREMMLLKILSFEVAWYDQDENATGIVCSRLAKDANVVRSLVGDRMSLLLQTVSAVGIAFTLSMIIAWRLAIVMIVVQPLIIMSFYIRRVLLKNMSKKAIQAQNESSKLAAEAVSNFRTITAFSSQARFLTMLEIAQEGPRKESIRQSWYAGIALGTAICINILYWTLGFGYGGKLISQGYITSKELFTTFFILASTGRTIGQAGSMTTDIAKGADAVASVFAILDRDTCIKSNDLEGYVSEKIIGHIEIEDVDFWYPTRPEVVIFKGFSLNIDAMKSTALVGHSGSGKSTIISLIERFYDPFKGVVNIDGRNIREYNLRSLRKHIALVNQEPTLFAGTIRENIIYGVDEDVDESEIMEAAKAANAHSFISGLKSGYDTWCGDRGVQLSGGQKQRIAIARAILRNPTILLLDEATSALDSQSEKLIQDALERVMVERTSVVVAHRLSTIQNCDFIVVMDKGKVVEKGTHSSLLAKGAQGAYYSLVNI